MNRKFFQKGFWFLFLHIVLWFGVIICILFVTVYLILITNWTIKSWIFIGVNILSIGILSAEIGYIVYHVDFQESKIYTTGDRLYPKTERIQHKTEILYSDIKDIEIIYTNKNSKNKNFSGTSGGHYAPKTYFEFTLHDGKKERLLILNHSKKQRREMISIINEKTGLNFDYDKMKAESHPPNERVLNWFRGFKKSDQKEDALGNRKSRRLVKSKRRVKRKKPTEKVK